MCVRNRPLFSTRSDATSWSSTRTCRPTPMDGRNSISVLSLILWLGTGLIGPIFGPTSARILVAQDSAGSVAASNSSSDPVSGRTTNGEAESDTNAEAEAEAEAESEAESETELTIEQIRERRRLRQAAVAKQAEQAATEWELTAKNAGWKRLSETDLCWIDPKRKQVIVGGRVCLREGILEMFACTDGTKEHESVVALKAKAYLMHTGLLAVGAVAKHPVQFRPEYAPAEGSTVDVFVRWKDATGTPRQMRAQQWVRDRTTKRAIEHAWVFGGSSLWTDPDTKKPYYRAESGEVICVSNFPTAMLDLPIESSQTNDELLFDAFTENIPPRDTPVLVFLRPKLDETPQE